MSFSAKHYYEFGPFRLDPVKRQLLREGEVVPLKPKVFETLLALVQATGQVMEKEELMQRIWAGRIVEEANLSMNISALRKALGESPTENHYIVTVPGQGYSFVAEVRRIQAEETGVLPAAFIPTEQPVVSEAATEPLADLPVLSQPSLPDVQPRRKLVMFVGVVLLVGLSLALYYWRRETPRQSVTAELLPVKSIVVLPFTQLNANADEYLGLGVADVLITQLSKLRQLKVRPTSAILRYKGQSSDPVTVGREQQVDAVLEGTIRQTAEHARVTVRLISVRDGATLWAEKFDEQLGAVFQLEDVIAQRLVRALALQLSGVDQERLAKRGTDNAEAYRLYLLGRFFWNKRTADGTQKALEYFDQAIKFDPNFALAYAGIAEAYSMEFPYISDQEKREKMKGAALKAMQLDEKLAEAHAALAYAKYWYEWDWTGAEQEFKRAIELNPNSAMAHLWYANYLMFLTRHQEAIVEINHALELDPLSLSINNNAGYVFRSAGLYDQAIAQFKKVLVMDASYIRAHLRLGETYSMLGMHDPAIRELEEVVKLSGGYPGVKTILGQAYAKAGRRTEALKLLNELIELCERSDDDCFPGRAFIYAELGDKDKAFKILNQVLSERYTDLACLKVCPYYDSLRSDPRFEDLMRRVGLSPDTPTSGN